MKKILSICTIVCLMFVAYTTLNAVDNGIYHIKVTITEASGVAIQIVGGWLEFGTVVQGTTKMSAQGERTIVKNTGGVPVTYSLGVSTYPTSWTLGSTAGVDTFVLSTVFAIWDGIPASSWFGANDVLTVANQAATAADGGKFVDDAVSSNPDDPNGANWDGYAAEVGRETSNFYLFAAPTSLSSPGMYSAEQEIQLTITAAGL